MKIKFTNFRRFVDVGALSGTGETIALLIFFVVLFGGLAFVFKEQVGFAIFFVTLTIACIYVLVNEVKGVLPVRKRKE